MAKRVITCLLVTAFIAMATVSTWKALKDHQDAQIARVADTEAYAARSQLARNIETMLRALGDLREYWARYGHLPRDQWESDAGIELAHFDGLELILWSDPDRGLRYIRTDEHAVFDYRPSGNEWRDLERLERRSRGVSGQKALGPFVDESGKVTYEIYLTGPDPAAGGALVAVIDSQESFASLLLDQSPGYALSVYWGDVLMYQRGEPAANLPAELVQEGLVTTGLDVPWRVVHTPTAHLADSQRTPAVDAVLGTGLAIAVLMGLLLFENSRARSRARAAENAEQMLADLNRDLEQQIADRVRQLAERSSDLETITESVAHDLRNPLNSISVNTQLLQQQYRDLLDDEGLEALTRMTAGVKRMSEILDRLLGLSVVSRATFQRQDIDVAEMVTEVFDELSATEQAPPVQLALGPLPRADADPTLVRTLVMNLLGNALKYTRDKPERRVEVSAEREDGTVVYCIRDNGIGFEPEAGQRIFRAFERLHGGGAPEGLGLGLDIATRIVRRHGGKIWAEGQRGQGAAFYFTLEPSNADDGRIFGQHPHDDGALPERLDGKGLR